MPLPPMSYAKLASSSEGILSVKGHPYQHSLYNTLSPYRRNKKSPGFSRFGTPPNFRKQTARMNIRKCNPSKLC